MQQNDKKMTIVTMAQRLDVSTATISNAFNRPDQLSAELRERILEECRRSGYAGPGRGRRRGRPAVLGLMLDATLGESLADPETRALIDGLGVELDRRRDSLLLLPARDAGAGARPQLPALDSLVYYRAAAGRVDRLPDSQVIALDCDIAGCVSIRVDQYAGARAAATHGMGTRPRPVAILGLGLVDSGRVCRVREDEVLTAQDSQWRQRLQGYLDGVEQAGGGRAQERIWHLPDTEPGTAEQAVREALACTPRPELLLCMDDRIAAVALEVAGMLGLRVPDQLRIVGFGGAEKNCTPSLTTLIPIPAEERGRLAARMLFGEFPRRDQLLVPRLLPGASCP